MNLLESRNIVRDEINDVVESNEDTDLLRWSGTKLTNQINMSANKIAQEFLHIQGTKQFTTVVAQQNYAFVAADCFLGYPGAIAWIDYITAAGGNHDHIPIQNYVSIGQFLALQKNASNTNSLGYWTFWNNSLYIPKPSFAIANAITVYIYKQQTELTYSTHDATELDGEPMLHKLVALHAALEIARRDKAVDLSQYDESKYTMEYRRQRALRGPKFMGPKFTNYRDF